MSPRRPEPPADRPLEDSTDPETVVRSILLRRLSHAPRTRAELEKDLARRGADPEVSAQVLDRFEEVGLIDDASYARLWVESRHRGKALARSVLKQELRQRGVDPESIDVAIEQIDDDAEYQRALEFASRKARVKPGEDSAKALSRLAGQLARKGYPAGVCFSVSKEVLGPLLEERQDHIVDEVDAGVVVDHFAEHQESV
jgi:regulatory protein